MNSNYADSRVYFGIQRTEYGCESLQFNLKGRKWITFTGIIARIVQLMAEGVMSFPLLSPQMAPMRPSHMPIKYAHEEHGLNLSKCISSRRAEPSVQEPSQ